MNMQASILPNLEIGLETPWPLKREGRQVYAKLLDFGAFPAPYGLKAKLHEVPDIAWSQISWDHSYVASSTDGRRRSLALVSTPEVTGGNLPWRFLVDSTSVQVNMLGLADYRQWDNIVLCLLYTRTGEGAKSGDLVAPGPDGLLLTSRDGDLVWEEAAVNGRRKANNNLTIYVRKTGNDGNTGLTPETAVLTLAGLSELMHTYDGNGYQLTVDIGVGTWDESLILGGTTNCFGFSYIYIQGAGHTLTIKKQDLVLENLRSVHIRDMTFEGTGTAGTNERLINVRFSWVFLQGTIGLGTCHAALLAHFGRIVQRGEIIVSGKMEYLFDSRVASQIQLNGPVHFNNTEIVFVASAMSSGTIDTDPGFIPTGSNTGYRYLGALGGVITAAGRGEDLFPGTMAGITDASSHYLA